MCCSKIQTLFFQLLIPTVDVLKVSKEKTAKIIPNAVGICTEDEKHVFGSLLSRDSTYKLMVQVWKAATDPVVELKAPTVSLDIIYILQRVDP